MSFRTRLVSFSVPILTFLVPAAASAQGIVDRIRGGVDQAGGEAGFSANGPGLEELIGRIIGVLLSFVGVLLLVILLYAGFLWMTAGGDEGKVKKARTMIFNAIVGLVITVAAYAISAFVLNALSGASGGGQDVSTPSG